MKQAVLNTTRPSPCDAVELAVSLAGNAAIQQVIDSIKNKPVEWGAVIKTLSPENVDSIYMRAIYTNNDTNSITTTSYWNNLQGYHIGFIHNHPLGGAPGPTDFLGPMIKLADMVAVTNISSAELENYVRNFASIIVSGDYIYTISIKNPQLIDEFTKISGYSRTKENGKYKRLAESYFPYEYFKNLSDADARLAREYALLKLYDDYIHVTRSLIGGSGPIKLLEIGRRRQIILNDPCAQ